METTSNSRILRIISILVLMLTTFQFLIPEMPVTDTSKITIVSAVTMFLVTVLTYIKNWLSDAVAKSAQWATTIIVAIAVAGAVNEYLLPVIKFSSSTAQWIRFCITLLIALLNVLAKELFPNTPLKSK